MSWGQHVRIVLFAVAAILLATPAAPAQDGKVHLLWLGQASFRLTTPGGKNIMIDPWVTQNPKTHEFVTHDIIHGVVTAVSSTSITVKSADNTSFTYTVNGDTGVLMRTAGQPHSGKKGAIGDVKTGDKVLVEGTGATSPYLAKHIVDGVA